MNAGSRKLELEESDFLDHDPEALRCNQCGGAFCGSRVGRMLDGEPFIMCGQKDAVREILASLSRR